MKQRIAAEQCRSCRSIWNRLHESSPQDVQHNAWVLCLNYVSGEVRQESPHSKYLKFSSISSVADGGCDGHEKSKVFISRNILHWAVTKICYGKPIRAREAGSETSPCNSHPASSNLQLNDLLSQRWYLGVFSGFFPLWFWPISS